MTICGYNTEDPNKALLWAIDEYLEYPTSSRLARVMSCTVEAAKSHDEKLSCWSPNKARLWPEEYGEYVAT